MDVLRIPETPEQAVSNITFIALIDLVLATIGLMLDIFVISEGPKASSFFYCAWVAVFAVCLGQGLMAINLFSGASQIDKRPHKSFKKINAWQIWSICLLVILIGGGVPVFALSNQFDEFFGFTITYLVAEIAFRLVAATLLEFNRDLIKREKYFARAYNFPSAVSLHSSSVKASSPAPSGLPVLPVYVNTQLPATSSKV